MDYAEGKRECELIPARGKKFPSTDERIVIHMNEHLRMKSVPEWLTKGRTVLIIKKDKEKGGEVSNFALITFLALMWKFFTGVLADTMKLL